MQARYWFISDREGFGRIGYAVDDQVLARVGATLATIVEGIERGVPGAARRIGHTLGHLSVLRPRRARRRRPAARLGAQAQPPGRRRLRRDGRTVNADSRPSPWPTPRGRTRPSLDGAARDRIAAALGDTLFVEAGAGSGKTRELVGRIVDLVTTGTAGMGAVAAVTFTEKAASELRDRVRDASSRARSTGPGGPTTPGRALAAALDDLDGAAIGTLHSFAQRLLVEHPIEAGLPPRIEVLDEMASTVAFDDRWAGFLDQLLANDAIERPLLLARQPGCGSRRFALVALAFNDNWDLAEAQAPSGPVELRSGRRDSTR